MSALEPYVGHIFSARTLTARQISHPRPLCARANSFASTHDCNFCSAPHPRWFICGRPQNFFCRTPTAICTLTVEEADDSLKMEARPNESLQ
ncbi:unnamed protein product [Clavelina lepadiformis]|uniref:Uncharacterized protein n=1 Tax=Clavelina lepadiformis TaxID=159417 RepID=A0ABP0FTX0_CLALP